MAGTDPGLHFTKKILQIDQYKTEDQVVTKKGLFGGSKNYVKPLTTPTPRQQVTGPIDIVDVKFLWTFNSSDTSIMNAEQTMIEVWFVFKLSI